MEVTNLSVSNLRVVLEVINEVGNGSASHWIEKVGSSGGRQGLSQVREFRDVGLGVGVAGVIFVVLLLTVVVSIVYRHRNGKKGRFEENLQNIEEGG